MYYIQILYLLLLTADAKPSLDLGAVAPGVQESSSVSIGSNLLDFGRYDSVIAIYSEVRHVYV